MKPARLLTLLLLSINLAHAEEVAPPAHGRVVRISGEVTHYKTQPAFVPETDSGIFDEEVYGSEFSVVVEGLPAGTYTAVLKFVEGYHDHAGARVMRISSGDQVIEDEFDLFVAAGGRGKPYELRAQIPHDDDQIRGPFSIRFQGLRDRAKLNAITILDSGGKPVAAAKAGDFESAADVSARRIPEVKEAPIYGDPSKPMAARIDDLIRRLSLAEKAQQLCSKAPGIDRLGMPAYNYWSEALHGVARNGHATVFPQAIGLAATWDENLIREIGEVIATEGRAKYEETIRQGEIGRENAGLNFWAPNVNIFRDPRWGRGQETYGEDPYLTSRMGVNYVEGVQTTDPKHPGYYKAMATAKHFAVHSGPEKGRGSFNVDPSTRDLYETYLPQFETLVREAGVRGVMSAYNALYGVPCSSDSWLLETLLRDQWGFTGHVVSDCGAVGNISGAHHYVKGGEAAAAAAILGGLDLECGGTMNNLPKAVTQGLLTEKDIDAALHRVLEIRFRLGLFDPPDTAPFSGVAASEIESPEHLRLALRAARESMTLLKNDGLLPLDKAKLQRIAVVGPNANSRDSLVGNYHGDPSNPVTILTGIRNEVGSDVQVDHVRGCDLIERPGETSKDEAEKALAAARAADIVIFVGGLDQRVEGEESGLEAPGFLHGDRTSIDLPKPQRELVQALVATGKPVIFVLCAGSSVALTWENENLPAILQAWYPGGEGGTAVADVLFGNDNPAGRLPVTFYGNLDGLPAFTDYRMTNRTYRYYTGRPLYPFGHGLSYTTFDYGPARMKMASFPANGTIELTVPVRNTGSRDGDEVVQVYLKHKDSPVAQPIHTLVAFERVSIPKGEEREVRFEVPVERFRYYDVVQKRYVIDPGAYELQIGSSSTDIRQRCEVKIQG